MFVMILAQIDSQAQPIRIDIFDRTLFAVHCGDAVIQSLIFAAKVDSRQPFTAIQNGPNFVQQMSNWRCMVIA